MYAEPSSTEAAWPRAKGSNMTLRIIQWNTGIVGSAGVRAIAAHPELELVGCFAWSPDKRGRDVGELCGLAPMGV